MKYFPGRSYLRLMVGGTCCIIAVLSLAPAGASSANISHSYKSNGSIVNGSIVSLDPSRSDFVQPANVDNGSRLLGVAVASKDSLLAVDAGQGTVQVATSGSVSALVSTVNGDVNLGDQVGVSPFNGVGMKAPPGARVIGLAQTTLNSSTPGANLETVTDRKGKKTQVEVGLVRLNIDVSTSPNGAADIQNLSGLQKIAHSITGHTVSNARVVVALVVAVVAILALITLIYASIYSTIIAVGRNPLAKYAVFRTLWSVLALALLTAVVASVVLYLLLH